MRFRIAEFKEGINAKDERFFVEIEKRIKNHLWWFLYWTEVVWEPARNPKTEEIIGHKTLTEAMDLIDELKKQIPTYRIIK